MKIRIGYIEEPPFCWTSDDHRATGVDGFDARAQGIGEAPRPLVRLILLAYPAANFAGPGVAPSRL